MCYCSTFLIILRFKNQTILVNFYFFDQMGIFCKMRQNFKFSLYFFVILLKEIFKHMKMLLKVTKRWNYKMSTICLGPGIWSKSIFFHFPVPLYCDTCWHRRIILLSKKLFRVIYMYVSLMPCRLCSEIPPAVTNVRASHTFFFSMQ